MDLIEKHLPETFYAGLDSEDRLKMLVKHWQRAIKINQELEKARQLAYDAVSFLEQLEEEGQFRFWSENGYNNQVLEEIKEGSSCL